MSPAHFAELIEDFTDHAREVGDAIRLGQSDAWEQTLDKVLTCGEVASRKRGSGFVSRAS